MTQVDTLTSTGVSRCTRRARVCASWRPMAQRGPAVLLLVTILIVGCTTPTPASLIETTPGIVGVLDIKPSPPQPMVASTLTLSLRNEQGQPLTGAKIALDLSMPGMEMPRNRPACLEAEEGIYRAEAMFTMGGIWCIRADVTEDNTVSTLEFFLTAE